MNRQMVNVRIFHATPTIPAVDVYLNDRLVQKGLKYRKSTEYISLMKGNYQVRLVNPNTGELLLEQMLVINDNRYITIIALAEANKVGLISLPDKSTASPSVDYDEDSMEEELNLMNQAIYPSFNFELPSQGLRKEIVLETGFIRFVHLSPNAPSVDIRLNNDQLFNDIIYKEATDYVDLVPGTYQLSIVAHNTDQEVLKLNNLLIEPNAVYTIYATGLLGGTPKLEAIILPDGR
jgi:Domain of unknown function (DUF4397)